MKGLLHFLLECILSVTEEAHDELRGKRRQNTDELLALLKHQQFLFFPVILNIFWFDLKLHSSIPSGLSWPEMFFIVIYSMFHYNNKGNQKYQPLAINGSPVKRVDSFPIPRSSHNVGPAMVLSHQQEASLPS